MALYLQPNYGMGRVGCLLAPQAHGTLLLPGSLLVGFYELCPNGHSGSQENVKVKTLNRVSPVDYPATRSEIKGFCQNPIFQLTFLHPPVRATVGEVRYSIEIDVGGE